MKERSARYIENKRMGRLTGFVESLIVALVTNSLDVSAVGRCDELLEVCQSAGHGERIDKLRLNEGLLELLPVIVVSTTSTTLKLTQHTCTSAGT